MSEVCGRRVERRGGIDGVLGVGRVAGRPYSRVRAEDTSRALYFFCRSRLESGISAQTCVCLWASGESAFLSMVPLSFCLAYHHREVWDRGVTQGDVVFVSVAGPGVTGPGIPDYRSDLRRS